MTHSTFSKQIGDPCQSFHPWPSVQSIGGGAVIPCQYHIGIKQGVDQALVLSKVSSAIEKMHEKSVLVINII